MAARAALTESSRLALADIRNRVGKAVLARQERVAAIHAALGLGRYVEIRGDAGVGKSGSYGRWPKPCKLRAGHCTQPVAMRSRGWVAWRAQLGFDGTLRELLVELANDGGATIYIDNLDFSMQKRGSPL